MFSFIATTTVLTMLLRPFGAPALRRAPPVALSAAVDASQLLTLAAAASPEQAEIKLLTERLETAGEGQPFLADQALLGNYEVVHCPGTYPVRGLFSLRGSFQHIPEAGVVGDKALGKLVNFVCFRALGLDGRLVALGEFEQLDPVGLAAARARNGTQLSDQTVRVTFGPPRVAIAGLCLELSGRAQPPVELCTTYLSDRLRLGRVADGGRFVFARGGRADEEWAGAWAEVLERRPTDPRLLLAAAVCAVAAAALRPRLVAQAAYAALGVGLGFASTKFLRFAAGGGVAALVASWRPRERMRALALRIDPSLAETEGEPLSLGDLGGPLKLVPRPRGLGVGSFGDFVKKRSGPGESPARS